MEKAMSTDHAPKRPPLPRQKSLPIPDIVPKVTEKAVSPQKPVASQSSLSGRSDVTIPEGSESEDYATLPAKPNSKFGCKCLFKVGPACGECWIPCISVWWAVWLNGGECMNSCEEEAFLEDFPSYLCVLNFKKIDVLIFGFITAPQTYNKIPYIKFLSDWTIFFN